jgi:hypothetical protein
MTFSSTSHPHIHFPISNFPFSISTKQNYVDYILLN